MAPKGARKRKSEDRLDQPLECCRKCESKVPFCQGNMCSRTRHFGCVNCLRLVSQAIAFGESDDYSIEQKGLNCFKTRCSGVYRVDDIRSHLIPEIATAVSSKMVSFTCGVCFMDLMMKDGLSCQAVDQSKENANETHVFCIGCIQGYADTDDLNLVCGVGLSCMQPDCQNALMMREVKHHLSDTVFKRIEDRVIEESVGHAQIEGLERCSKCNYAVEVLEGRYFVCICGHKQCRTCGATFDTNHGSQPCYKKKNKEDLNLEEQLNDLVVRYCHKCNVRFVKSSGCNHMKCRCGATQCYLCRATDITYDHFCKCFGFENDCKCNRRCRQFADSSHVDSHRMELLISQAANGKKTTLNNDILTAMPDRQVEYPLYSDDEDDDDYDGPIHGLYNAFAGPLFDSDDDLSSIEDENNNNNHRREIFNFDADSSDEEFIYDARNSPVPVPVSDDSEEEHGDNSDVESVSLTEDDEVIQISDDSGDEAVLDNAIPISDDDSVIELSDDENLVPVSEDSDNEGIYSPVSPYLSSENGDNEPAYNPVSPTLASEYDDNEARYSPVSPYQSSEDGDNEAPEIHLITSDDESEEEVPVRRNRRRLRFRNNGGTSPIQTRAQRRANRTIELSDSDPDDYDYDDSD